MTCTCLACMDRPNRPWRLGTAPWPSRGKKMTENNKTPFTLLYVIGACIAGISTSTPIDSSIPLFVGFMIIFLTGFSHLTVKLVSIQKVLTAGTSQQGFVGGNSLRSQFHSNSRSRGNYGYDQLIRKMQVSDLSGMSVAQAASKYASFFKYPSVSATPFFSSPYVREVLNIGTAQVSAQAIAGSSSSTPQATSNSNVTFWSSMPESSTQATDVCANPTCLTPVTVFDFRCFNCRNRFCAACKGNKITCPSCS